jgi:hypothetical protein
MKFARQFSMFLISLFCLSLFSYGVYIVSKNEGQGGLISKSILEFAKFPGTILEVLTSEEVAGIPPTYVRIDEDLSEKNTVDTDVFALGSFWNDEEGKWQICLLNLRTEDTIHQWMIGPNETFGRATNQQFPNSRVMNSILLPERGLIAFNGKSPNLLRLDEASNIVWSNHDKVFHHSMNLDKDGNVWICSSDIPQIKSRGHIGTSVKNFNNKTLLFTEDYLTKIDLETGKILFDKGITEILLENNLDGLAYGLSAPAYHTEDILHLNDIEPALDSSEFWDIGDLFISLRHRSAIIQYRPNTNEVIRVIQGPFMNQHDVDIISNHEISLFNNNWVTEDKHSWASSEELKELDLSHSTVIEHSQIIVYDFETSTYSSVFTSEIEQNGIKTKTEGLHHHLNDGSIFIEEQNAGNLYILTESNTIYRNAFETPMNGYAHLPNWFRIYESIENL